MSLLFGSVCWFCVLTASSWRLALVPDSTSCRRRPPRYLIFYNFYRAIDKHNFLGLRRFKIHPDKDESQDLNDKVTGGLRKGWWLGVGFLASSRADGERSDDRPAFL